jgi:hypothetical protein
MGRERMEEREREMVMRRDQCTSQKGLGKEIEIAT